MIHKIKYICKYQIYTLFRTLLKVQLWAGNAQSV